MLVEGIKSRPVYKTLTPRPGRLHYVLANAQGALAAVDLIAAAPDGFLENTRILYVPGGSSGEDHGARLEALGAGGFAAFPTSPAAADALRLALGDAGMGAQVYAAGTEDFIGQVVQAALDSGIDLDAIGAEHRGSLERRVQCVHCKTITDQVTTQPVQCTGCGLMLLVRDHYSRRLGAFQGVNIDAEEPGTAPDPDPVFA
jgi:hypothetical protein